RVHHRRQLELRAVEVVGLQPIARAPEVVEAARALLVVRGAAPHALHGALEFLDDLRVSRRLTAHVRAVDGEDDAALVARDIEVRAREEDAAHRTEAEIARRPRL